MAKAAKPVRRVRGTRKSKTPRYNQVPAQPYLPNFPLTKEARELIKLGNADHAAYQNRNKAKGAKAYSRADLERDRARTALRLASDAAAERIAGYPYDKPISREDYATLAVIMYFQTGNFWSEARHALTRLTLHAAGVDITPRYRLRVKRQAA
ncbi:MAG: hypothetical protein AB7G08_21920 [Hyphomicrobiaceae bacterium]